MDDNLVVDIREPAATGGFGNKGLGLHWLSRHHLTIPETSVLTFAACRRISASANGLDPEIAQAIAGLVGPGRAYAIRSSASVEDGQRRSFAGQFVTKTNVRGVEAVLSAVQEVLASADSATLRPYLKKLGEGDESLEMAVLIQEMVDPVLAGVAFSKNPTTGLDEVVIEAVQGLGERLMQGGLTPDRWIYRWGQFTTRAEGRAEYEGVIRSIAVETRRIASQYGAPVDLEWAYDGSRVYWLQVRPITMLAQVPVYSNRISREVLPGIIKPLIASVNIPLVNSAWIRLFEELLGPTRLEPEDLTRLFHYRAYFNMAAVGRIFELLGLPRESLEMLLGLPVKSGRPPLSWRTLRHLPRLLRFGVRAWNYDRRAEAALQGHESSARQIQQQEVSSLSDTELVQAIQRLTDLNSRIAYQNIVIPLLMSLYSAVLKAQLGRSGIDIVDLDVTAGLEELRKYDPNPHLEGLRDVVEALPPDVQAELPGLTYRALQADPRFAQFVAQLDRFMERFGHLSDSGNDFSRKPWREEPNVVVRMAVDHAVNHRDQRKDTWETLPISGLARWRMKPIYRRARRMRFRREQVSSLYTSSYGWFRVLFGELSRRLVARGALQERSDIYYLTWPEIQALVVKSTSHTDFAALVQTRRQQVEDSRDIVLPETIYGDTPPPLTRARDGAPKRKGIPTSPGYYQGPLKVIRSTKEFHKVKPGDVIAIPYSDVAWTPLFARAGAVVAEAGGMLSHSSIVAREYGIPCVVSVEEATALPEGRVVYVDGYQGEVTVVSDEDAQTPGEAGLP